MFKCMVDALRVGLRVVEYHVVMAAREAVIESEWVSVSSYAHSPASS